MEPENARLSVSPSWRTRERGLPITKTGREAVAEARKELREELMANGQKSYKQTEMQMLLCTHLKEAGISYVVEYQFTEHRRFRFDIFLPLFFTGIECNGGRWKFGHRSSRDTINDNQKTRLAQLLGFKILPFANEEIADGRAIEEIREWLLPMEATNGKPK